MADQHRTRRGSNQRDPGEPTLWRTFWSFIVAVLAIGWYVTGSPLWGYQTRWTSPRYVRYRLFDSPHVFSEAELTRYTGQNPDLPILLAINGSVFDVSARPDTYGPIGSYRFFSGKDAARAFATGCFSTDLTHDLRELDDAQLAAVRGWHSFFANHHRYWQVGTVEHPPLTGPPPPPCQKAQRPG